MKEADMSGATQRQRASEWLRIAFEFLCAVSAGMAGLAGLAYFLFAPRLAIGTASPECDAFSNPSACIPPSYYSLVETTFSPWWAVYFALLALLFASIPMLAVLHIRMLASQWRWALVVVAALVLLGAAPVSDSLRFDSPIAILQSGVLLAPGVVLGIFAAVLAFLDRRHPAVNPSSALAIQG
jgi:hypothetical protein